MEGTCQQKHTEDAAIFRPGKVTEPRFAGVMHEAQVQHHETFLLLARGESMNNLITGSGMRCRVHGPVRPFIEVYHCKLLGDPLKK